VSYEWIIFHDNGTVTELDNVQGFTITKGRQQVQDPFRVGRAVITGRVPSSLPTISIGDTISISNYTASPAVNVFRGEVADFAINYGTVPSLDTWEIICEDGFASLGRTYATGSFIAGDTPFTAALYLIASVAGLTISNAYPSIGSSSSVSGYSFTNASVFDLIQQLIFTEQGRIYPIQPTQFAWVDRAALGQLPVVCSFSDGTLTPSSPVVKVETAQFYSQADSRFDRVIIEPDGLAAQISGSSTGKTFEAKSFDQTTTQAKNLADYVLQTLQVSEAVPFKVNTSSVLQSNLAVLDAFVESDRGGRAQVILRGVLSNVFLQGATLTATPDQTRFAFNVISSEAQNFFVLDSVPSVC
jgi:hypothetical protein